MKQPFLSILAGLFALAGCSTVTTPPKETVSPRHVDDIAHDTQQDSDSFKTCHGDQYVIQYFNNSRGLEYEGGKPAIVEAVHQHYDPTKAAKESGLVRVRFIVNCNGESGRFRVLGMDEQYQTKIFSTTITNQLVTITKNLKGWKVKQLNDKERDYYQYLIFKLEQGAIVKILP